MSTMVSKKKEFIFIHINKAAGSSISRALSPYDSYPYLNGFFAQKLRNRLWEKTLQVGSFISFHHHATAREVRDCIGVTLFYQYFKFAFVRNPWAREVSKFCYRRQNWRRRNVTFYKTLTFAEFVEWEAARNAPRQIDFLTDGGSELMVDFVGRVESINHDIDYVSEKLGFSILVPHLNRSQHEEYRRFYTPDTRRIVEHAYAADIEYFQYRF